MKKNNNRIAINLIMVAALSMVLVACFKEFDPDSYKPPFTIGGFTAVDEIQPSSLVAYWSFDEDLKESVSGNASTNSGTTLVNGFKGKAINLNVSDHSYITYNATPAITGLQSFTISFWVNPTFVDANGDNGIDGILGLVNLSNPGGFWGNLDWFVENGSNPSTAKIVAHISTATGETWMDVSGYPGLFNTWSNHTLTYDATSSKFTYYINGSSKKTANAGWPDGGPIVFTGSGPMVFGCVQFQTNDGGIGCCGNQPWASYLTGGMDEVRIYNKALLAAEVNALVVLQGKGK